MGCFAIRGIGSLYYPAYALSDDTAGAGLLRADPVTPSAIPVISADGDIPHRSAAGPALTSAMPKSSSKSAKRKAPWKKPAPKGTRRTSLSPSQKARARKSAKRAGRPYPNLVDNMQAAKRGGAKRKRAAKPRRRSS
jgi:hypothetical protein